MFTSRPERSVEVVLLGRSNVGKSTIMRELTGRRVPTGRRPGVTTRPTYHDWAEADFLLTDLPGFGFMAGVPEEERERIKTGIVRYLEAHAEAILVGVLVLDGSAAVEIIDRHLGRGDPPYDLELYDLLVDLDIEPIITVNKMDKVDRRDETLDAIAERFGLAPPWQQWRDRLAPITARDGRIDALLHALYGHLEAAGHGRIRGVLPSPHQ
ncbi:MAG: GTP-binding protein EngB [Halobacteriota archaeon]